MPKPRHEAELIVKTQYRKDYMLTNPTGLYNKMEQTTCATLSAV